MKRLFEDPMAPSELRNELLRSQRAGRDYDVEGKLSQLRAALSSAQPNPGEPVDQATSPSLGGGGGGAEAGLSSLAPLALKLTVLAALGGVAVYLGWPEPAGPEIRARAAQAVPPAVAAPLAEPNLTPALARPEPAVRSLEPAADTPAIVPPRARAEPATPSSRREIAQLVRIRALLERDPAAAHRLAERGEREFPRGVLSEERRALQVLALARSGDMDAATERSRAFFAKYPQSPMRDQVEAALRR